MLVQGVELVHHSLRIGVDALVELHCVPAVLAPVLPVLHQGVDREIAFAELFANAEDFPLSVIPFTALPVTVYPPGKQRSFPRELAVIRNDAVQLRAVKEVVIDGLPNFGAERARVLWGARGQLETARPALCANFVLLVSLQAH